ncbi:hypothetical protein BKI52_16495 [marine bacterium AO1-C]|nr:hypothetical protein BKI52_16495 [marine bacterium AO1-C]
MKKHAGYFIVFLLFVHSITIGQNTVLTTNQKTALITKISDLITTKYVFPQKTKKITQYLKRQQSTIEFKTIESPKQFAKTINRYLRTASNDLHLWVGFNRKEAASHQHLDYSNYLEQKAKSRNYGFRKVEILEGNIGYLHMNHFYNPRYSEETLSSALHFLSNCDALILDLRKNSGGSLNMVNTLDSYFFGNGSIITHRIYYRSGFEQEVFTQENLKGKSLPKIPLYILVDKNTASAAEQVAYNLKHLNRATIVGEVTMGTANTGLRHSLDDNLYIFIANGEYENDITRDTFEHKGVKPQIETKSSEALQKAHVLALKQKRKLCKEKKQKKKLNKLIRKVKKDTR